MAWGEPSDCQDCILQPAKTHQVVGNGQQQLSGGSKGGKIETDRGW